MKSGVHLESVLVAWAARRLNRPVRWIADRTEGFLTDEQAREMRDHRLARSGRGRKVHRAETALGRQPGRLRVRPVRLGRRQYRRHRRGVRHPVHRRAGVRRADPYRADRRLSRGRPAGSDLRHRAPDRRRRPGTGDQPVRTPPPQPDPARGDALQDRADLHLRLRRIRRQHAGSRRAVRLRHRSRNAGRKRRNAASCAASVCATASRSPAARSCARPRISRRCGWRRTAR